MKQEYWYTSICEMYGKSSLNYNNTTCAKTSQGQETKLHNLCGDEDLFNPK